MTWTNPPAVVTQWRDQLLACASVASAGIVSARAHYPALAVQTDTLPAVVVADTNPRRDRYAEGSTGLPSGNLVATFYLPTSSYTDAGSVESFASAVIKELMAQSTIIPFRDVSSGLASDPTPGARAAGGNADHRTITITATYGLRAG